MNQQRQRILLSLFAGMVVLWLGDSVWSTYYEDPMAAADKKATQLDGQIRKAKLELKRLKRRQQLLDGVRNRSLPTDLASARSLYQGWLSQVAQQVELASRRVDSSPPRPQEGFHVLPFSLRGTGTLQQFTDLLFQFYRAPHLHQIRALTITPLDGRGQLNLNLSIEALVIDGAKQINALGSGESDVLASVSEADYRCIAQRNIFSANSGADTTSNTLLTAVVWVNDVPEAWFTSKLEEKVYKVRVGDLLTVGTFVGRVAQIADKEVTMEAPGGQQWLVPLHASLNDAIVRSVRL